MSRERFAVRQIVLAQRDGDAPVGQAWAQPTAKRPTGLDAERKPSRTGPIYDLSASAAEIMDPDWAFLRSKEIITRRAPLSARSHEDGAFAVISKST